MGYWGYGGFNNYPGPMYGAPWVGGPGYPGYGFGPGAGPLPGQGPGDTFGHHDGEPKKKAGGITGFFQGIAQGGVNLIKGIFSPGGILMLGVTGALTWLTGGAILPILGALGAGVGGYQILKGIADGDSEKAGEGVFNIGTSMLGFLGPERFSAAGKTYELEGSGFKARVGSLFGGKYKHIPAEGEAVEPSKNLYELSFAKIRDKFTGLSDSWQSSRTSARGNTSAGTSAPQFAGASRQADHVQMFNDIIDNEAFSRSLGSLEKTSLQNMRYKLQNNKPLNRMEQFHLRDIHRRLHQVEHPFPKKASFWSRLRKGQPASSTMSPLRLDVTSSSTDI